MWNRFLAAMSGRRYGLRSKDIKERPYHITVDGNRKELFHSAFNINWFPELKITPHTIIDLGSFDGGDAYRFKDAFPDARVITVEADPTRHAITQDNLSGQDIEIANYAACDTDGDIDWYVSTIDGEPNAQGSIYKHTDAYREKFTSVAQAKTASTVRGRRFDTLAEELSVTQIDLLHMDIEGAEHTVLQSMGKLRPRLIYLEWREGFFHGKACGPDTEALLASMNYKLILKKTADRLYYLPES